MFRELKKKMLILSNRQPFPPHVKEFSGRMEKRDWICRNLRFEGSGLKEEQVEALLRGEYVLEASVWEHLMIERLSELLDRMHGFSARGIDIDLKLINTFHNIITGRYDEAGSGYRKKTMMITEWEYGPALPAEIPERMVQFRIFAGKKHEVPAESEECIKGAVQIHSRLLQIFPYGEDDRLVARAAMTYFMMTKGYPAVLPDIDESAYNEMTAACCKKGEYQEFSDAVIKALSDSISLMIQLTAY